MNDKKNVLFIVFEVNFGPVYVPKIYIPYNMKLLGTILKKRGHNVTFCHEKDLSRLDIDSVDVVCLSTMTDNVKSAYKLAEFFRARGKKVIMGGVHVSMLPEEARRYADHVVIGEADSIICDVVEGKRKEKIIHGRRVDNLDELPFIDRSLSKEKKWFETSTSRGCPYNCNYCTVVKMHGNKYRARTPENVIEEVEGFKDPKTVFFIDDNFVFDRKRAKEILKRLKDNGFNSSLIAQSTINIYKDEEMLKLLGDLNACLFIGIENTGKESLEAMNKRHNILDIKKAVKTIKDNGIDIFSWYIMGSDADDLKTIDRNAEEFLSLDIDVPIPSVLTPFVGSEIYNQMEREGRLITKDWDKYDVTLVTYLPKKMKAYELQKKYLDVKREFHDIKKVKMMFRMFRTYFGGFHMDHSLGEKALFLPRGIKQDYLLRRSIQEHLEYLEKNNL